jgi:hypothetical protein
MTIPRLLRNPPLVALTGPGVCFLQPMYFQVFHRSNPPFRRSHQDHALGGGGGMCDVGYHRFKRMERIDGILELLIVSGGEVLTCITIEDPYRPCVLHGRGCQTHHPGVELGRQRYAARKGCWLSWGWNLAVSRLRCAVRVVCTHGWYKSSTMDSWCFRPVFAQGTWISNRNRLQGVLELAASALPLDL